MDRGAAPGNQSRRDPTLEGKVALVTAASTGLGFACARRLASAGCRVGICARRIGVLAEAEREISRETGAEVCAVPTDLTRADQVERFVDETHKRFGRVDALVANSGHSPYGTLEDLDDTAWYAAFELLLMSTVRLAQLTVPLMRAQGEGDIVFITSSTAKEPPQHLLLSNVFRAGEAGLAKTLARSLAPHNIRVNVVAPGYFDTGRVQCRINEAVERDGIPRAAAALQVAGEIPMGRIGVADELAELVTFLVSRRAGYLTGATIQIDGGSGRGIF